MHLFPFFSFSTSLHLSKTPTFMIHHTRKWTYQDMDGLLNQVQQQQMNCCNSNKGPFYRRPDRQSVNGIITSNLFVMLNNVHCYSFSVPFFHTERSPFYYFVILHLYTLSHRHRHTGRHIHTHTHTGRHIHTHTRTLAHTQADTDTHKGTHTHIHRQTHTVRHTHTLSHTHTQTHTARWTSGGVSRKHQLNILIYFPPSQYESWHKSLLVNNCSSANII